MCDLSAALFPYRAFVEYLMIQTICSILLFSLILSFIFVFSWGQVVSPCRLFIWWLVLRDDFKTQPPVDWRFHPVPGVFYCSKQWQPPGTRRNRRSTGGWVLKPPLRTVIALKLKFVVLFSLFCTILGLPLPFAIFAVFLGATNYAKDIPK